MNHGYGSEAARDFLSAVRRGRSIVAAGGVVRVSWCSTELDAAGFKAWIADNVDKRINYKAGLTTEGAPVVGRNEYGHALIPRRWESIYQTNLARDARAIDDRINRRIMLRQLATDIARRKCGHLIDHPEED